MPTDLMQVLGQFGVAGLMGAEARRFGLETLPEI